MQFADLVAPLTPTAFMTEHCGKAPVHLPGARSRLGFTRARLDRLLDAVDHWTPARTKLVYNGEAVAPQSYLKPSGSEWLARPAAVRAEIARGASLVADQIELIAPELAAVSGMMSHSLGAQVSANAYLSSGGVGAFGPHYDLSDVFAVHCEGEKIWRLYAGRVEDPVSFPPGDDAAVRAHFRRAAGAVVREIAMRPGDVLYIPRGWYHDALAQSEHSLHVTFSVQPFTGKIVLRLLLERLAIEDAAFRRYLPDAHLHGEAALEDGLRALAARLGEIVRSPEMLAAVKERQMSLRD